MDVTMVRDLLIMNIAKGLPCIGKVFWIDGVRKEIEFIIPSPTHENVTTAIEDAFGNVPFNSEKYWVSIACGNVCSVLPTNYIDIYTCDGMEALNKSRNIFKKWVSEDYCIADIATSVNSESYEFVLNHKRL